MFVIIISWVWLNQDNIKTNIWSQNIDLKFKKFQNLYLFDAGFVYSLPMLSLGKH